MAPAKAGRESRAVRAAAGELAAERVQPIAAEAAGEPAQVARALERVRPRAVAEHQAARLPAPQVALETRKELAAPAHSERARNLVLAAAKEERDLAGVPAWGQVSAEAAEREAAREPERSEVPMRNRCTGFSGRLPRSAALARARILPRPRWHFRTRFPSFPATRRTLCGRRWPDSPSKARTRSWMKACWFNRRSTFPSSSRWNSLNAAR